MITLKNDKGSMIIWAPVIMLILLSGIASLCEYSRLQSTAMNTRNAVQAAITQVCTDNTKNVYTGIREGYAGGYKLENVSWDNNVSDSDILSKVDAKLGTSAGVKSVNGKLIYKITDLSVRIQNAPLAPTDTDGVKQFTGTATFTLTVPLSFGGQSLPPMVINDIPVVGGYSQKGEISGTGGGGSDQGKAASGISLSESQLTMETGAIDTLAASVSPEDATDNISWVATNPGVCAVDQTGTIMAKSAGQSTIIAAAQSGGAIAQCNVTVITAVTGVTLNKSNLTLAKGQSETLTATISPADATNKKGKWASSDASVCTVDGNGTIYAVNAGTAVVSAVTEDGGFTDQCTVTVVIPTSGITLNKTNLTLIEGTTETLTATVWPGDATKATVLWASSDESICTVDQAGKIVAIKPGNAVVSATTYDGQYTAVCAVTVKPNTYTVSANAVNGYVTGTGIYNAGSTVTLTAHPNAHYHFVCWTDSSSTVIGWDTTYTMYNLSADTTVNAVFAIDTFTVTANSVSGGYVTGGGTYAYGTWITISATPYSGYKFVKWSDGSTQSSRSFTVTGDVSYTAYFARVYNVGDTYSLGGYNWTVLDINSNNQATLLCQSTVAYMRFCPSDRSPWWGASDIRTYLNGTFYNSLPADTRAKMTVSVHKNACDPSPVSDYVWVLSISEICGTAYNYDFGGAPYSDGAQLQWFAGKTAGQQKALFGYDTWDWTRSYNQNVAKVYLVGGLADSYAASYGADFTNNSQHVRPVIMINLY